MESTFGDQHAITMFSQITQHFASIFIGRSCTNWYRQHQILTTRTSTVCTTPIFTTFRHMETFKTIINQRVQVIIGQQVNIAAITTVTTYLAAHDRNYPTTELTAERLRDGWRLNPTTDAVTIYYITDDSHIVTAPATTPTDHIASQMSAEFRARHPIVNPPPAHDTGNDIFD